MKTVKIYSQLALLCLLMMSMGFPSVIAEDETDSDTSKSKSVRYVKVGFLACTRQVTQAKETGKVQDPKCVSKEDKSEDGAPAKVRSKVSTSVETISCRIQAWLSR